MESNNFTYEYLKFVSFSKLTNWSVQYIINDAFSYNKKYPLIKIEDFLIRNKTPIEIQDNEKYKRVTIKVNNGGVYLRDIEKGINIGTKKQFIITTGQFLLSKIDARNGAFGVVPSETNKSIITGNFWTFDVDYSKINPYYLSLIVTTPEFINFCQNASNGTTNRHYLQEKLFLEVKIPLPSLEEQNRLVENYTKKTKLADKQEQEARQLEQEIENYLLEELGIQFNYSAEEQNNSKIRLIHFKDVDRWAVDYLKASSKLYFLFNAKYQPVKLKKIILSYQYGLSQKATKENIGIPILRMNNIFESQLLLEDLKYIEYNNSVKKFILNKGDLLFNRTNSKELVGKTAVFEEDSEYTFASYLIRVVINDKIADNKYINYLFNSSILQFQKNMISRQITGQANINAQEMQELLFPLPPLEKQKEIVEYISDIKDKIKKLHILAKKNREEAIQKFEEEIFN